MERPTCGTCPYWDEADRDDVRVGECKRFPPVFPPNDKMRSETVELYGDDWMGWSPETSPNDFCGEHPSFPAYVASLKPVTGVSSESGRA